MEEKKIGMGWYEFLRYFTYGLGRLLPFVLMGLCLLIAILDFDFIMLIPAAMCFIYFAFLFVVHRHLENYSENAGKWVYYPHLIAAILSSVSVVLWIVFEPGEMGDSLVSAVSNTFWFIVNYEYFKKRSHIFVNKCSFLGKLIETPVQKEPAPVEAEPVSTSKRQESPSEQQEISKQHQYKFCRICGRKMEMDDMFCSQCGTKVLEEEGE